MLKFKSEFNNVIVKKRCMLFVSYNMPNKPWNLEIYDYKQM